MKTYTYQIGEGVEDTLSHPLHSTSLFADSLDEAIVKAKAMTRARPPHDKEIAVRIIQNGADESPVWASSVKKVRAG